MPWRTIIVWSIAGLLVLGVASGLLRAVWPDRNDHILVVDTTDPVVKQYLQDVFQHLQPFPEALKTLDELMTAPQVGDDAWTTQATIQITTIQNAHTQLAALDHDLPQPLQASHTRLLRTTDTCSDMTLVLSNGIDTQAMGDIERARTLMERCKLRFDKTVMSVIIDHADPTPTRTY